MGGFLIMFSFGIPCRKRSPVIWNDWRSLRLVSAPGLVWERKHSLVSTQVVPNLAGCSEEGRGSSAATEEQESSTECCRQSGAGDGGRCGVGPGRLNEPSLVF